MWKIGTKRSSPPISGIIKNYSGNMSEKGSNLSADKKNVQRRWNDYFEGLFVSDDNLISQIGYTNVHVYIGMDSII